MENPPSRASRKAHPRPWAWQLCVKQVTAGGNLHSWPCRAPKDLHVAAGVEELYGPGEAVHPRLRQRASGRKGGMCVVQAIGSYPSPIRIGSIDSDFVAVEELL